jgi:hypothetical protein
MDGEHHRETETGGIDRDTWHKGTNDIIVDELQEQPMKTLGCAP